MKDKIIALTGSHGVGKTTAMFQLAQKLKIEHPDKTIGMLHENVAYAPGPINKETTAENQLWIFTNQIQAEITMAAKYDLVISDRSAVDAIAYTFAAEFYELAESMLKLVASHIKIYRSIIFKSIKNNDYFFDDGFREADDRLFRQFIENKLIEYYHRLGIKTEPEAKTNYNDKKKLISI